MEMASKLSMMDVFVGIRDPRQAKKVEHDLVALLAVMICGVLAGADDFVEIEEWAKEKLDWFQRYLALENGIPSHDTFGRVFAVIDADEFAAAFRRWVSRVVPALENDEVVSIDGKTSRRSGKVDATPLHWVSAFAANANLVLGQRATAEKTPHAVDAVVEKDHGRLEVRCCYAFSQLVCRDHLGTNDQKQDDSRASLLHQ